jgi:hypothetical protein
MEIQQKNRATFGSRTFASMATPVANHDQSLTSRMSLANLGGEKFAD